MVNETEKPFAPACERNQQVILDVMRKFITADCKNLLEIGSGTGQHAVYMAARLPQLTWHTSDVIDTHQGIKRWLGEAKLSNVSGPLAYEVGVDGWPEVDADVVFTANTLHIISLDLVTELLHDIGENLKKGGRLMIYGPFKYQGQYTSSSNADFDQWLKDIDPKRGIRDFEFIKNELKSHRIKLIDDIDMPANNQLLIFGKYD
jgi:predicted O-methyltransferase YrrM